MSTRTVFFILVSLVLICPGCSCSGDPEELRRLATEEYEAEQKAAEDEFKTALRKAETARTIRMKAAEKTYKEKLQDLRE